MFKFLYSLKKLAQKNDNTRMKNPLLMVFEISLYNLQSFVTVQSLFRWNYVI